MIYLNPQLR